MITAKLKRQNLTKLEAALDTTTDYMGQPIDPKIRSTVLFLQAVGITTTQSCQGHLDHGRPWPWVRIEAPEEPEFRFGNEFEIYNEISQKFAISVTAVRRGEAANEVRQELWQRLQNQEETPEFKVWARRNLELRSHLAILLADFYAAHHSADEVRLEISEIGPASFELESAEPARQAFYLGKLNAETLERIRALLPARQAEMQAFAAFLEHFYWQH